jgi:putative transposase
MANTYTKLHFHYIFSPHLRQHLIRPEIKDTLEKYMTGIVQNKGQKVLAIHCSKDHCHLLAGLSPLMSCEHLIREVKSWSSRFLNQNYFRDSKFCWQRGYGCFSVSANQVNNVIRYIRNQDEHHRLKTFQAEYLEFLKENEVKYDEQYLFDFIDDSEKGDPDQ